MVRATLPAPDDAGKLTGGNAFPISRRRLPGRASGPPPACYIPLMMSVGDTILQAVAFLALYPDNTEHVRDYGNSFHLALSCRGRSSDIDVTRIAASHLITARRGSVGS